MINLGRQGRTRKREKDLILSLDANIQEYAQQAALKVMEEKQAERVSILLMNPQNGEIYACVNVPEFDLNDPFTLNEDLQAKLDMREEQTIEKETEQTAAQIAAKTKSKETGVVKSNVEKSLHE